MHIYNRALSSRRTGLFRCFDKVEDNGRIDISVYKKPTRSYIRTDTCNTIAIPYIPNITEKMKRVLQKHHFIIAEKPVMRLKNILTRAKDRFPIEKQTGIVYSSHVQTVMCSTLEKQVTRYKQGSENMNGL